MEQLPNNQPARASGEPPQVRIPASNPGAADPAEVKRRAPGAADGYRFTDQRIIQHFEVAIRSSQSIAGLLSSISKIVTEQSDCLALWVCQKNDIGDFGSPYLLTEEGDALWVVVEDHATEMIKRVARTRQVCSSPISSGTQTDLVSAPVIAAVDEETPVQMVLVGCFSSANQSVLRQQWLVGMVSQSIGRWHQKKSLESLNVQSKSMSDTIGLVHAIDQTETIRDASMVVVNHLRRLCNAEQVSLALCEGRKQAKIRAISDVEKIDRNSEANRLVLTACKQTILADQIVSYPAAEGEHTPAILALDKYCKSNSMEACVGLPLKTEDGRTIGSLLIGATQEQLADPNYQQYLNRLVSLSTGHLDVVLRANRGLTDFAKERWSSFRKSKLTKLVGLLVGAALLAMCIPWPYRVRCECEIQPVLRRFIASPYDGILEKTFVEGGSIVEKDQVVAHLDGSQLRIELAGLKAEYEGARKRRDSALAQGEVAPSQIARSEMRRHQARVEILEKQLEHLEVRTPISGIVVSGDLEKVEGAPLEMGKTLFEVAPLDNMLAEIGIPESEIQYAKEGMPVAIKLDAFPFKTWNGEIEKIHPRSEIIDDDSVFIAQVRLPNLEDQLRPGMKGSAKIKSKSSPIGWNLFHRSWESVRYWLVW